jgi:IclR family pca regulon transcriptional regulator
VAISEAASLTGLTRAAARCYLLGLVHLGYAEFDGKLFSLTPRVMRAASRWETWHACFCH